MALYNNDINLNNLEDVAGSKVKHWDGSSSSWVAKVVLILPGLKQDILQDPLCV